MGQFEFEFSFQAISFQAFKFDNLNFECSFQEIQLYELATDRQAIYWIGIEIWI